MNKLFRLQSPSLAELFSLSLSQNPIFSDFSLAKSNYPSFFPFFFPFFFFFPSQTDELTSDHEVRKKSYPQTQLSPRSQTGKEMEWRKRERERGEKIGKYQIEKDSMNLY